MSGPCEAMLNDLGLVSATEQVDERALGPRWHDMCRAGVEHFAKHGRFESWMRLIASLPPAQGLTTELNQSAPRVSGKAPAPVETLTELGPWKKGPFDILGAYIDAEWRSDLKWNRFLGVASPLQGRRVLDVGTGNGYFLLRAAGAGAAFTLGLEPSAHYCAQYLALQRYFGAAQIALLPLPCEAFELQQGAFDSVLSMGVLYHRRSPIEHLSALKAYLRSGGELVVETIVVDGPQGHTLVPEDRYAGMRNVWCVPSMLTVEGWLRDLGMREIRSSRPVLTTSDEQRSTSWTSKHSLLDFLDPSDPSRTVEGHPAPERAFIVATAP